MRKIISFFKVYNHHNLAVVFLIVGYLNKLAQISLNIVVNTYVSIVQSS